VDPVVVATLVGAGFGAVGAIAGGYVGAWEAERRHEVERREAHKTAVRLVYWELQTNLQMVNVSRADPPYEIRLSTSSYDKFGAGLFPRVPAPLAERIARAYGQIYSFGTDARGQQQNQMLAAVVDEVRAYAIRIGVEIDDSANSEAQ
jgi:hypothetical protein